jgi:hypothetical protein
MLGTSPVSGTRWRCGRVGPLRPWNRCHRQRVIIGRLGNAPLRIHSSGWMVVVLMTLQPFRFGRSEPRYPPLAWAAALRGCLILGTCSCLAVRLPWLCLLSLAVGGRGCGLLEIMPLNVFTAPETAERLSRLEPYLSYLLTEVGVPEPIQANLAERRPRSTYVR